MIFHDSEPLGFLRQCCGDRKCDWQRRPRHQMLTDIITAHTSTGGGYPILPMGGTPIPGQDGGIPPSPVQDGGRGNPLLRSRMGGVPHPRSGLGSTWGTPHWVPPVERSGHRAATRWAVCLLRSRRRTFLFKQSSACFYWITLVLLVIML